jgi:hypothetical protein
LGFAPSRGSEAISLILLTAVGLDLRDEAPQRPTSAAARQRAAFRPSRWWSLTGYIFVRG